MPKQKEKMNRRQFISAAGMGAAASAATTVLAAEGRQPPPKQPPGGAKGMFRSMSPGAIGVKGSFEETLKFARMGGFEGLDGSLSKIADMARKSSAAEIKALYDKAGLRVGGLGLPREWRGEKNKFDDFIAKLPEMAAAAREVGAEACATWLTPWSRTLPFRENFRFHVSRFRPVAEILKDCGMRLGLEPVGPRTSRDKEGYGFLYTIYGALALAEAIGTGNVGLLLDSWHWHTALGTASDLATLSADDVVHVHINDAPAGIPVEKQMDNVRALPGETGVIDLKTFLTSLKKIGYRGAVTPEPMSARLRAMTSEEAAKTAGAALKNVWDAAGL